MAVNKVVNKSTKSHGAMRNVIEYVLQDRKVREGYVNITGPYSYETIGWDQVYNAFLNEKRLWDKDSGRMYTHNIISFHKDEKISPEQVLEICKEFVDKFFNGFQCLIGVHQDKDHLHGHIVTNTVSYIDGKKLHQTKHDLEKQKQFTNNLCRERGLSVTEKGKHFDGTDIEQGNITAWSKDKYNLLLNDTKKSYVVECAIAITEVLPHSASKEDFISGMEDRGWSVQWEDTRKHITFKNKNGDKVRDSNLEKTFAGMQVNKEALLYEFERQNERIRSERDEEAELERYYAEIESAAAGLISAETIRNDTEITGGIEQNILGTGLAEQTRQTSGSGEDTETLIREIRTKNCTIRDSESCSVSAERSRRLEEQRRALEQKRARDSARRAWKSQGHSR